jgi:DNA-binding transcriptional LysR family regulator
VEVRRLLPARCRGRSSGEWSSAISYDSQDPRVASTVFTDHLAFVVPPAIGSRPARPFRSATSAWDVIAHNVVSYRKLVLRAFEKAGPLHMGVEMPTVEAIRKLVQANEGVAFLPRMCVEQEIGLRMLREVAVKELKLARQIRLVHPARRALSHAATAFLDLVKRG